MKATKKKVKKAATTKKKILKLYNVFYTPVPYEAELIVKAHSPEEAVDMVKRILGDSVESVKAGWELDPKSFDGTPRVPTVGEVL